MKKILIVSIVLITSNFTTYYIAHDFSRNVEIADKSENMIKTCEKNLADSANKSFICSSQLKDFKTAFKKVLEKNKDLSTEKSLMAKEFSILKNIDQKFSDETTKYQEITDENELKNTLVKDYFELANVKDVFANAIDSSIRSGLKVPPELNKQTDELFNKYYSWNSIEPKISDIYKENFTAEELEAIIEFHETELGQSLIKKIPNINSKIFNNIIPEMEKNKITLAKELKNLYDNYKRKQNE